MPARAACLFTIWGPTLFEHYPFLPSHDCVAGLERPASASGLVPRSLQAVQSPVRPFSPVSGQASAPCFPCRHALARTQFWTCQPSNPCWLTVLAVSTWCWLTGHNLKSRQPSVPVADSRAGNCDLISGDIETQLAISTCPGPLACCCCNSLKLLLLCVPLSHLPCSCISESRSVTRDWLSSLPQSGSASTRSMPTPSTGGHRLL